jgi:hypothetical protein
VRALGKNLLWETAKTCPVSLFGLLIGSVHEKNNCKNLQDFWQFLADFQGPSE